MSGKTFENNGKNITEIIVKLKLGYNIKPLLYNHWSTHVQREQMFDNFMISLPDNTEYLH